MHERSSIGELVVLTHTQYAGFLGRKIEDALLTKGMRIIDLSDRIGTTYETARRLVRGQMLCSTQLIRRISKVLGIGVRELKEAVKNDRAHRISPRLFWLSRGINPALEPIVLDWPYLTDASKERLTEFVVLLAKIDSAQSGEANIGTASQSGTENP